MPLRHPGQQPAGTGISHRGGAPGGHQQILMALRDSRLTDDNLVNAYYDLIIDTYDYVGII